MAFFFFQAEDGIRDKLVTGVQTCALPILARHETIRQEGPTGRVQRRGGEQGTGFRAAPVARHRLLIRSISDVIPITYPIGTDHCSVNVPMPPGFSPPRLPGSNDPCLPGRAPLAPMRMYEHLLTETTAAGVRTITLNRPERLNAVNPRLAAELPAALDEAARDDAARVVVVTGAGRGFCAGLDLADPAMLGDRSLAE